MGTRLGESGVAMLGHDVAARALVEQGVDTVFAVLGDGNLFIAETMMREHGVRFVAATHEANAVLAAEGWAKATGRLGVATITHGPGLTNTFTALVEAVKNRTPMLVVAADTPTEDRHHLQNFPQRAFVDASGAGFQQVLSPATITTDTAVAIRRAWVERRPIVLNLPLDFEWVDVEYVAVPKVEVTPTLVGPDPAALDTALGIIASAARPIVLAGKGATSAAARDALGALARRLGAPVATSLLGTNLFRDDPCNLGIFGTLTTPVAGEVIASADCIVAFGASLNRFTQNEGAWLKGKRVVHVDLDPAAIGVMASVDAGVVGDSATVALAMCDLLDAAGHQPAAFRSDELAARLAAWDPATAYTDRSTDATIDPRTLAQRLDEILPADRTIVVDAGRFMLHALDLPVRDPQSLITSHAFGSIGLGTATAMGVAVARPDRATVLMVGDGGFMMGGLNELHTAVAERLDLIVVLHNDSSYGAEHVQLWRKNMSVEASMHDWPNFTDVARALGFEAVTVHNPGDLELAAKAIATRQPGRPVFIEAIIDPLVASELQG